MKPEFFILMNYHPEMLDIKFYEDRWKDSTAIRILSIHLFFVSIFKIINEMN